jgi:hypothetical protein
MAGLGCGWDRVLTEKKQEIVTGTSQLFAKHGLAERV